jgi:AraC-like DNA-binding protein
MPAQPTWNLERLARSSVAGVALEAEAEGTALVVTGQLTIERAHQQHWWGMLPPWIMARASAESAAWLEATLAFIASEAESSRPGTQSLLSRLSDLLVLQVLRRHTEALELGQPETKSWLNALAEPQIGASLALLHSESARAWTVEGLARKVGMSRSAFAARFTRLVGQPPLYYLTCVRMQQAASLLRDTSIASAEVAERVGYVSDTAFCKAFKRAFGQSPGAYRRQQKASPRPEVAA